MTEREGTPEDFAAMLAQRSEPVDAAKPDRALYRSSERDRADQTTEPTEPGQRLREQLGLDPTTAKAKRERALIERLHPPNEEDPDD